LIRPKPDNRATDRTNTTEFGAHRLKAMAGAVGFEPTCGGSKVRCLTTWRRPNGCRFAPSIGSLRTPILPSPPQAGRGLPTEERAGASGPFMNALDRVHAA